jgi:hypothetical protein
MAARKKKIAAKKSASQKLLDQEAVAAYMANLDHPLKEMVESIRKIIKSNKKLTERIKWNAPSYHYTEDLVTFSLHNKKAVLLVFHHPEIVKIKSTLLEGDYKDRRLASFNNMESVRKWKKEIVTIIDELVKRLNNK